MIKYPKINTLYKRDNKTYKIIKDDYSEDYYPNINEWYVEEKIDGNNIRFSFDANQVEFCGRNDNASIHRPLENYLKQKFTLDLLKETFKDADPNSVVLFGEGYGSNIQKGEGKDYREDCSFVLFDVKIGDFWLKRENVNEISDSLGIRCIPNYGLMKTNDIIDLVKSNPQSQCSVGNRIIEGIVARTDLFDRMGNRVMFKLKARDFA